MCVIIYKPSGVEMPSSQILWDCYRVNHHGMGFATPKTVFRTLSYQQFFNAIKAVKTSEPCIIHFRWATHGSVKRTNCHPFSKGGVKFAHNGVLPIESKNDMTDSEIAFRNIIYPAIQHNGFKSEEADRVISQTAGSSRFAIMVGRDVELFGHWDEIDGCFYSNLNWQRYCFNW